MMHRHLDKDGTVLNLCCRRADLPPLESDDDWVTQDVVPIRVGVDEFRYVCEDGSLYGGRDFMLSQQNDNFHQNVHGWIDQKGDRIELRCRRKDLPKPPEPEPAKTRVELRLWVNETTGELKHTAKDLRRMLFSCWHEVLFDTTGQPYYLKD